MNKLLASIIVPVYNGERTIGTCLESLLDQTYPRERYEIIVVDNGSTDNTRELIKKYPVRMTLEDEIRGSYAARNAGIKNAEGEIFAFTDADCIADPNWIEEGVKHLIESKADLVGGKVEFVYNRRSPAELYDSITNMQNEYEIKENKIAKTANLFVKPCVFEGIGLFPKNLISGGDVIWTQRATSNGYKLAYAEGAIVKHPARGLSSLAKKHYRVGKAHYIIWLSGGKQKEELIKGLLSFLPPRLRTIKELIEKRGTPDMKKRLAGIWFAATVVRLTEGVGRFSSMIRRGKGRKDASL
jgi:glycosyltransferase involved in cell wall biosynthesis